ncbi:MAG: ATP-binding protein [Oscillospiraceae bacterium]
MDELTAKLVLFSELGEESILSQLASVYRDWKQGAMSRAALAQRVHHQVKRLLDLATQYGFDENLWQDYLTFLLLTTENSFSLTAERVGVSDGSILHFAMADLAVFRRLFCWDFASFEAALGLDCFQVLTHYRAIAKPEKSYYRSVSALVRKTSRALAQAESTEAFFRIVTTCYRDYGVGMFGLNRAFRIRSGADGGVTFLPINNTDKTMLSDLVGYELQKRELVRNTEAFLRGQPANNVLLYGDAGTGKSSCVKALLNEYYDDGLRMIEIYKHQFHDLSAVIAAIKQRHYRFIIYIDDLSFEESEMEYKFLKAVIEGGVETRPDNILIYATSNRRHLVQETWKDRDDMETRGDIHHSDTMEEKLSLSARFGVTINFSIPNRQQYHEIVQALAARQLPRPMDEAELLRLADRWEIRHGGVSGRTAQQFIHYLAGKESD